MIGDQSRRSKTPISISNMTPMHDARMTSASLKTDIFGSASIQKTRTGKNSSTHFIERSDTNDVTVDTANTQTFHQS